MLPSVQQQAGKGHFLSQLYTTLALYTRFATVAKWTINV